MSIAGRRFSPSIFATVLVVRCVAGFIRLGLWQRHRAAEKEALIGRYGSGGETPLELTAATAGSLPQYQHVRAAGHYDTTHQILLDNMPSQHGQPGYRVVTPFELAAGGTLLVDRGWVPMGRTRQDLPSVAVDTQSRDIAGRYDSLPRPGIAMSAKDSTDSAWPRVLNYPQQQQVETALGRPVLPGVLLLDAERPDGYERAWQARFQFGPERHLAYAVQWFGLATAAIVIYLIVSFRREQHR
ncbi:MAG TPA: SURF1 family protein [Povalibacter sp.]|uniref:SURF1 family protein n=1 Tax=Povalibacter sp. TaxID=1962978 RepID=UPI002CB7216D|nr:SURF1 family protein [Povalibacter sp.]HMN44695.1 SURF1 family protein [Povalibacter sp.]